MCRSGCARHRISLFSLLAVLCVATTVLAAPDTATSTFVHENFRSTPIVLTHAEYAERAVDQNVDQEARQVATLADQYWSDEFKQRGLSYQSPRAFGRVWRESTNPMQRATGETRKCAVLPRGRFHRLRSSLGGLLLRQNR